MTLKNFKGIKPKSKNIIADDKETPAKLENLNQQFSVRFTGTEMAKLTKLAHEQRLSKSGLIRSLLARHGYI